MNSDRPRKGSQCLTHAIEFLNLPIEDRSVPSTGIGDFVTELAKEVESGKAVGFHCRAGPRSLLLEVDRACAAISDSRGCYVPDTREQKLWVKDFDATFGPMRRV